MSGRSLGSRRFELGALVDVVGGLGGLVAQVTGYRVGVLLTDFDGAYHEVLTAVSDRVATGGMTCAIDDQRQAGRGYYPNVCFKLVVDTGDDVVEVGDGGTVDWASALLQNRKERLLIGGVSLERLLSISRP